MKQLVEWCLYMFIWYMMRVYCSTVHFRIRFPFQRMCIRAHGLGSHHSYPFINKQFPASPSLVSKEVWAERYQTYCKSYSLSNWQAQSAHWCSLWWDPCKTMIATGPRIHHSFCTSNGLHWLHPRTLQTFVRFSWLWAVRQLCLTMFHEHDANHIQSLWLLQAEDFKYVVFQGKVHEIQDNPPIHGGSDNADGQHHLYICTDTYVL